MAPMRKIGRRLMATGSLWPIGWKSLLLSNAPDTGGLCEGNVYFNVSTEMGAIASSQTRALFGDDRHDDRRE